MMKVAVTLNGTKLYDDFSARVKRLIKDEGLVDVKMKVFSGRETTVDGLVLTLSNVLRLYEENKFKRIEVK